MSMTADTPVLRLKGVNKRFGGVVAANDVDLDLPPGIVTALVGPNGAGKTTLFNLITGNLKPDSGAIELRGVSLAGIDPRSAALRGIARSFQDLRLFEQMTVFENVLSVMERSALPWQPGGRGAAARAPREGGRDDRDGRPHRLARRARDRSRLRGAEIPLARAHSGDRRVALAARRAGLRARSRLLRPLREAGARSPRATASPSA